MARAEFVRQAGMLCAFEGTKQQQGPQGVDLTIQGWIWHSLVAAAATIFIIGAFIQLSQDVGLTAPLSFVPHLDGAVRWATIAAAFVCVAILARPSKTVTNGRSASVWARVRPSAHQQSLDTLAENAIQDDQLRALKERRMALEKQAQRLAQLADDSLHAEALAKQRSALQASLLASVSHELRTPLNAVIGFADVMNHELHGPLGHQKYQEYVADIGDSGRRLLKTIEDLVALNGFGDIATNAAETIDLGSLLDDCFQAVGNDTNAPTLKVDLERASASALQIVAEQHALRQAIIGLMLAMSRRLAPDGAIEVRLTASERSVRLDFHGYEAEKIGAAWRALERHADPLCADIAAVGDLGLVTALLARSLMDLSNRELSLSHDESTRELRATLELPLAARHSANGAPLMAVA